MKNVLETTYIALLLHTMHYLVVVDNVPFSYDTGIYNWFWCNNQAWSKVVQNERFSVTGLSLQCLLQLQQPQFQGVYIH